MSIKSKKSFDQERFEALLKDAVAKVNTEEDPYTLNEMKKLFKKNVPFNRRLYVAAYLANLASGGFKSSYRSGRDASHGHGFQHRSHERFSQDSRGTRPMEGQDDSRFPSRRVSIDESVAATLFVSIGRTRRVFPRDLVGLFIQVAGVERERIGDIRTLENYSFVQVFKDDAEKIIAALDGYEYRGRKLSVSHSRKKEDLPTESDVQDSISGDVGGGELPEQEYAE